MRHLFPPEMNNNRQLAYYVFNLALVDIGTELLQTDILIRTWYQYVKTELDSCGYGLDIGGDSYVRSKLVELIKL